MRGGERMSDFIFSLFAASVKTFVTESVKAIVKVLAKSNVSRTKEETAPTLNRDGSDNIG
jgi:hypothetical protein